MFFTYKKRNELDTTYIFKLHKVRTLRVERVCSLFYSDMRLLCLIHNYCRTDRNHENTLMNRLDNCLETEATATGICKSKIVYLKLVRKSSRGWVHNQAQAGDRNLGDVCGRLLLPRRGMRGPVQSLCNNCQTES